VLVRKCCEPLCVRTGVRMSFLSHSDLQWLVQALQTWIPEARVQRVRRRNQHCLILQCHRPGQAFDLVISIRKEVSRICVSTEKVTTKPTQDTISTWLKSTMRGHRLTALTCDPLQRLIWLSWPGGKLVIELFGKQPRLLGLDAEGLVRCIEPPTVRDHVRLGELYEVPVFSGHSKTSSEASTRFGDLLMVEREAVQKVYALDADATRMVKAGALKRARTQLERLKSRLERDRDKLGEPEVWQRMGELLKAQAWRLERGMTEIDVVDYFDPEMLTRQIPLLAELNGADNIERYFKKYRRGQSGRVHVARRLEDVNHRLTRLNTLTVESCTVDEIELALRKLKIKPAQTPVQAKSKNSSIRLPYFEFFSQQGERIFVGRGGTDNHQTSFKVGKGNDHWFHVKDAPGAHVLVPVRKGKEPHPETIKDALALALHYSKLRDEHDALVTHTQRKHVRPVVGGKAGLVTVQSEKVKPVDQLQTRIKRLFEDRAPI
jgi:predicted ribosome quality control (RQC) complex YloA/Tae2 family protein